MAAYQAGGAFLVHHRKIGLLPVALVRFGRNSSLSIARAAKSSEDKRVRRRVPEAW